MKNHFLLIILLCTLGINAATLFVESLDDTLGSAATLRQVIMDASSGDTIQFDISGTILLDEMLGELVIDKQLIINGQNKIIIDGQDQINICFHIINAGTAESADASGSVVQNIAIQNFNGHAVDPGSGTASQELPAYGILIDGGAISCSITNTAIKHINSGLNQEVAGIKSEEETLGINNNIIEFISSENNTGGNSGKAYGILIENTISGDCSNNTVCAVSSGNASGSTGGFRGIIGISIDILNGNCLDNTVHNITSGNAGTSSGDVLGISFGGNGTNDIDCLRNTVYNLSTGSASSSSGLIFGLSFNTIINNCSHNRVYNLNTRSANNTGQATGIIGSQVTGDCSFNTIHTIHSEAAFNNSGALFGLTFSSFSSIIGNCSNNTIYNLASGAAGNDSGLIFGMRLRTIEGNFLDNSICNIRTGNGNSDAGQILGVDATSVEGDCLNNTVCDLSSGTAGASSRGVIGISIGTINGTCSSNKVQQLSTGDAPNSNTVGLLGFVNREMNGNFVNNIITDLSVASASLTLGVGGASFLLVGNGSDEILIACNTIHQVTGGQDNRIFGMEIREGTNTTIRNNTINSVINPTNRAHGLILGNSNNEGGIVRNSLVSFNSINTITGNNSSGFGITILGEDTPSTGNDLLNNSIFNINGKAINIIDNGVPVDATVTLQSAICSSNKIMIRGTVEPEPGFENAEFLVQFFTSNSNIPPQTMVFLGEETTIGIGSGSDTNIPFLAEIKGCFPQTQNKYITATATAQPSGTAEDNNNNNTSEVSNTIAGCNTNSVCAFVCTPAPATPACPVQ